MVEASGVGEGFAEGQGSTAAEVLRTCNDPENGTLFAVLDVGEKKVYVSETNQCLLRESFLHSSLTKASA